MALHLRSLIHLHGIALNLEEGQMLPISIAFLEPQDHEVPKLDIDP